MTKAAFTAVGLAVLLLCAPTGAAGAAAAGPTSAFRAAPCPFPGANLAEQYAIDCGYVTVPEHRDRQTTRTIELAVAIAHQTGAGSGDPVIFLNGGPGDSALIGVAELWGTSTIRDHHDLILFDQRGTGYSRPALPCQPLDHPPDLYTSLAQQPAERTRLATICLERYRADGIDVTAYTTRENAADVEAIRQALGIDRWRLYGVSYGTRLALEVMRTHGSSIDGAVLDSPYPPQARPFEDATARFERALGAVLAACHSDSACADAYPGVGDRLSTIFADADGRLDREYPPIPAWYAASVLNASLYSLGGIAQIPAIVDGLERGNAMFMRVGYARWQPSLTEAGATGMNLSVECHDRAYDVDDAAVAADRASHTQYGSQGSGSWLQLAACAAWGADRPNPEELAPVVSDVPTLVLVGAFDPVTPPSYAAETVRTLPNGHVVELPGLGHAVTLTPCGHILRDAFLVDPTAPIDRTCVEALPPATFATDIASVPGLPYLLDGLFGRSNPSIGQIGIMLLIAMAFGSAIVGWPLMAAAGVIRGRRFRAVVVPIAAAESLDATPVESTVRPEPERTSPRSRMLRAARLGALVAIGADLILVAGLVRVVGAMPEGSLIRVLGVPRPDRWLIWVADLGAAAAIVVTVLTCAALARRAGRRRSRLALSFVAFGCLLFSGALAYYRILE